MNISLAKTIGNREWLAKNEDAIKKLLPQDWTLVSNISQQDTLRTAFGFKVLGLDWRTNDEFGKIMLCLERLGILQHRDGYLVRANPQRVFSAEN